MTSSKPTKVGSFQKQKKMVKTKDNQGSPNQKIGNFTGQQKLGDFSC